MANKVQPAVAYLRTSSAANVGADKDSDKRQRAAIEAFAKRAGFSIVGEYYDKAVSGADRIDQRPGFAEMLQQLATDGAKTIIVESPDRFARDLAVQLAGHDMLKGLGIAIIPASAPDFFTEDTPTAVLVRQVLGAIAQFEKASSVAKLAAARKRKREREGRCERRKPLSQTRPEVVALARKLRRRRPKAGQLSLREVSKELAARGYLNERNKPYAPKSVASMCVSGGLEGLLITGTGTGVCRWSTARGRGRYAVSKATMGNETQTRVNRPTACSAELWSSPVTEVP